MTNLTNLTKLVKLVKLVMQKNRPCIGAIFFTLALAMALALAMGYYSTKRPWASRRRPSGMMM